MFSKKLHADIKKSTQKIQDLKKESSTRFKHLKIFLENVDIEESRTFFDLNYSHIYYIFYDNFIITENNLKQKELPFHLVHKAHREELDTVLLVLEKILTLCPELLSRRWQIHSLSRIMTKLLHPGNSWKLRREAMRFFLLWYQTLGDNSTDTVHALFATLVPGFSSPFKSHLGLTGLSNLSSATVFHDANQCPISAADLQPIFPPQGGEKQPDDPMKFFLDALLEFMVTQVVRVEWKDKIHKQTKSFMFLFDNFKTYYLPHLFPSYSHSTNLYNPILDLSLLRPRFINDDKNIKKMDPYINCRVVFIKWIANFTHYMKKDQNLPLARSSSVTPCESEGERSPSSELRRVSVGANITSSGSVIASSEEITLMSTAPNFDTSLCEGPNSTSISIVRDVLFGTRSNINLIHEVYRQAFLLNFNYSPAIRRTITVYKDWIQSNIPELPPFMLEPVDGFCNFGSSTADHFAEVTDESGCQTKHWNDVYIGANLKENHSVRAGLQNLLQVFITHAANVFLIEINQDCLSLLEEQVDICKRVLNIYRYMVMHTEMEPKTWEQLLLVLLHITSVILSKSPPKRKEDTLGGKLAPAIFQTLIVTWIKANLNVFISTELWDEFMAVLSSLTQWEELIREWAKTLDTLTRVLARHIYHLDLNDLPLDRLSEQKSKRQKKCSSQRACLGTGSNRENDSITEVKNYNPGQSKKDTKEAEIIQGTSRLYIHLNGDEDLERAPTMKSCESLPSLRRTVSDSTLNWAKRRRSHMHNPNNCKHSGHTPGTSAGGEYEILTGMTFRNLKRKYRKCRSLDSIYFAAGNSWYFEQDLSRSPSPAPSSGVESNSFKESPMQIDMLSTDGTNIDVGDGDRRSVMSGGSVKGWIPDVAVVLWRRMLGSLGNVNTIKDPSLHAQVFQHLVEVIGTLTRIKQNLGVPMDNQPTSTFPELAPPIPLIAPWCFQALILPDVFHRGKQFAYRLLCNIVLACHDLLLPSGLIKQFYWVLHRALTSGDQNTVNTVVKYCGPRFFSLQIPGFSLLLLDFIHAANTVVNSSDIRTTPRDEAISIMGSLLSFPSTFYQKSIQIVATKEFVVNPGLDAKEHIIKMLLHSGKTESSGKARCVALSCLGIFVYQQLCEVNNIHLNVNEAINTLLLSLKFNHKTVAQVASDVLLLLCDHSKTLQKNFPDIPPRIVEVLASTLSHLMPIGESDKRLITSLVFCLGEWTMHLPQHILLTYRNNICLLNCVFKVLTDLSEGGQCKGGLTVSGSFHPDLVHEFNPNIQVDNLRQDESAVVKGIRASNNSPPHLNSPLHSIQLAAKMVMMHLLNHVGHFPLAIGAAHLCSLVVEQDDVPGLKADQLSAQVFSANNIQLLVLSTNLLMSLVELPALQVPGGGVTAGLVTATMQVRIILRDLTGKSSWDASILHCTSEQLNNSAADFTAEKVVDNKSNEEMTLNSCILAPSVPQHTLRHRSPQLLPTFENSADDLDNLDDLLQFIGETSPECLENLDTPRNIPIPPFIADHEQEAIGSVVSQRFYEQDFMTQKLLLSTMQAEKCTQRESKPSLSAFQHCRLLFSQLGFTGWERRSKLHLLDKSEKLLRELRNLDTQKCRETHKIAIIYIAMGQEEKNSILSNTAGSHAYENFIAALAWEVELESHTGFMGGLQKNKTTGSTAPYYASSFTEVIFHVSTRMPSSNQEALLQKTRHLGNDEVHIVWSEHSRDYRRGIIPTEFCDVLIVIYPLPHKLFRIQVSRKPEVPYFGPLFDEVVVAEHALAGLVRATALSASRAKRSVIPFHQQYYEERHRSLENVMKNQKNTTTFEEFAAQVFSPINTQSPFSSGPSTTSGTGASKVEQHIPLNNSTNLAAALLDCPPHGALDVNRIKGSEVGKVWFIGGDGDHLNQHGISPRPLKKLVLMKSGTKRAPSTPPDSPTSRRPK